MSNDIIDSTLHIVSQRSLAITQPLMSPLCHRGHAAWHGPSDAFGRDAKQPAATVAGLAGRINLFPAIVRDDLSGVDPELICISLLSRPPVLRERKVEIGRGMTSFSTPSGCCFSNGHKLKLNLYADDEANNTSNLFLPLWAFKKRGEEERSFNN